MYTLLIFFLTLLLGVVLPARTAWCHDAPTIAPARLDFDASQAPKNCNNLFAFLPILDNWVAREVWSSAADRRLVVHIRRSPNGGTFVVVTLVDAAGATVAEHRKQHGIKIECYEVLYDTAHAAAKLLGAFEKPPPPEPPPICPVSPPPAAPTPCPTCPAPMVPPPRIVARAPTMRLTSLGAGVFLGMGDQPVQAIGPLFFLEFLPSPRVPDMRIEIEGAFAPYVSPKSKALRGEMVPLFLSLCYAPSVLHLCSGLVTTFSLRELENDAMRMTLAASLRLGTEFEIAGPFSMRLDAFGLVPLGGRTFGRERATRDSLEPFMGGASVMGVWSFE